MQQRHDNPFSAVWTAIRENLGRNKSARIPGAQPSDRLDGKTVMVTGSNSGLGKGVAVDLASRGARVLMACRSGIPGAGHEVRGRSGNPEIEMLPVDLADLESVHALCDTLRDRGETLDVLVCNAGVVPKEARQSAQGYELMVAVNFLAKTVMLERLLRDKRCGGLITGVGITPDMTRTAQFHFAKIGAVTIRIAAVVVLLGEKVGAATFALRTDQVRLRRHGVPAFDGGDLWFLAHG